MATLALKSSYKTSYQNALLRLRQAIRATLLVLSFAGLNSFAQPKTAQELLDNTYEGVRAASLALLQECPPKDCSAVGIGRSVTPFIEFLEVLAPNYAHNLPLSSFHYSEGQIRGAQLRELYAHFDLFLNNPHILKKKKIIIFDYTVSGTSLFSADSYIAKYFKRHGITVVPVSLVTDAWSKVPLEKFNDPSLRGNRAGFDKFRSINLSPELEDALNSQEFDFIAKHQSFVPFGFYPLELNDNPERLSYLKELRRKIKSDTKLKGLKILSPENCAAFLRKFL